MARAVQSEAQQRLTASRTACFAADVQIGILLPGKRGLRQVFGGGGGAHGHGDIIQVRIGC